MITVKQTDLREVPSNIITMRALLILVLRITFVTFCSTDGDQGGGGEEGSGGGGTLPCVTCAFMGFEEPVPYKMKVEDVPAGCDNVLFGNYFYDKDFPADDTQAIQSLVENGHSVYTVFAGYDAPAPWVDMMTTDTKNDIIEKMATFMKDNKISGILLETSSLLRRSNLTDLACHMNTLLCKIKQCYPTLIVGMLLSGMDYKIWPNKEIFDFSVCNADFFLIDTEAMNTECGAGVTRRLPMSTLNDIWGGVAISGIDPNRLLTSFGIRVSWKVNNTLQMSKDYSQAQFAKQNSKGMFLTALNKDDYKNSCGCNKFPVANAYIDGWNSKEPTCCIQ